ncbi:hypothetical protein [Microbulbifer sp. YPW1]|uniref:hypothetical protein n=1 Tax=Microbulbifer sp. YPW1 TaxID=2745199 RepID=UPI00272EB9A0|nr:hypothetical protein [Microbulbifer sp. YPW1]
MENPVCRWSLYDAKKAGVEHSKDVPKAMPAASALIPLVLAKTPDSLLLMNTNRRTSLPAGFKRSWLR